MKKRKVSNEEFEKMELVYNSGNKHVNNRFNLYFSYTTRIIAMFLIVAFFSVLAFICFKKSFTNSKNISLSYEEKDNMKYEVNLLDNNLFQNGELEPTDSYISDLIDNISTDLSYEYGFGDKVNVEYNYYVNAYMILRDKNTNSEISNKEFPLVEKTNKSEDDITKIQINQNINLDYDYYNNLAKEINKEYDLDLTGNLLLRMYIDVKTDYDGFEESIKKSQVVEVKIPLLSSQVKVSKISNIDRKDVYIKHTNPELENELILYIGIILLIIGTIFLLLTITFIYRSTPKKSRYRVVRDGLLNEYNKKIVNSKNLPDLKDYKVIVCTSFRELMDAQRLLDKPIIYNEIVKDQKCVFIIIGTNEVYKFTLKECDIEYS